MSGVNPSMLTSELMKIAKLLVAGQNYVTDDDLVKSCLSLAKYNHGLFKSEKQGYFLKGKIKRGTPLTSNSFLSHKMQPGDVGLVRGTLQNSGSVSGSWALILDDKGVREYYWLWWKYKEGRSREDVDREFAQMSDRERDRHWGLQDEMTQGEWVYGGAKLKWSRG